MGVWEEGRLGAVQDLCVFSHTPTPTHSRPFLAVFKSLVADQQMSSVQEDAVAARYEALWAEAQPKVARGAVQIDEHLSNKSSDARRGLSVVARPPAHVAEAYRAFRDEAQALEPALYAHRPAELHVTVLALFTATADYAPYRARRPRYQAAVADALDGGAPFSVVFRGVTASPGAVMLQGFPQGDELNALRGKLRRTLTERGLGGGLDGRYTVITAHMTALRFRAALDHPTAFTELLARYRDHAFGTARVEALQFVENDWYLSAEKTEVLKTYALRG